MNVIGDDKHNSPAASRPWQYILAPFVPTPYDVVDRMLTLGEVSAHDYLVDLGCGDGRILITAAKTYGARGMGVDIEPYRVAESQTNARLAGVDELVTFKLQDALTTDLSPATVVMLYLVQWSTLKIKSWITRSARAGTRVVSHNFDMGDWQATGIETVTDSEGDNHKLYLWTLA
jgi:SAM-dependent methyltransferase